MVRMVIGIGIGIGIGGMGSFLRRIRCGEEGLVLVLVLLRLKRVVELVRRR
jgi:hypothetical protein